MKKSVIFFIVFSILIVCSGWVYILAITIPVNISRAVTEGIESATGNKAAIRSVNVNLFKGFVIDGLAIYDEKSVILRAKEVSGIFLTAPVISKHVIIPVITIDSPSIILERGPDRSFNITKMITDSMIMPEGMALTVYKVVIKNGRVDFVDNSLAEPFVKEFNNIDANINISLPAKVAFAVSYDMASEKPVSIESRGEYIIPDRSLYLDVMAKDVVLADFLDYYEGLGISFPEGVVDIKAEISLQEGILDAKIDAETKNLSMVKDNMILKTNSLVSLWFQYNFGSNEYEYAGKIRIQDMSIFGIGDIGDLHGIKALAEFDDTRLWSDNISVAAFGMPWKVKINMVNFADPIIDIYADSEADLGALQKALGDRYGAGFPIRLSGLAGLEFSFQIEKNIVTKMNGYVKMKDASAYIGNKENAIEHINGEARITPNTLEWSDIRFDRKGTDYISSAKITNFDSPGINLSVDSNDLSFKSIFAFYGKEIFLSKMSGRYFNSEFSASGSLNIGVPENIKADVKGSIRFDIKDLKRFSKNPDQLKDVKISGRVDADFQLKGYIKDPNSCIIDADIRSDSVSVYGLIASDVGVKYFQEKGVGYIKSLRSSFYGGSLWAAGTIEPFNKDAIKYSINMDFNDVKLSKLKNDTEFKDKDVSGDIKLVAKVEGAWNNADSISGVGRLSIARGKLWQLNLFQGLGVLIFTSDFSDIVFDEGSCDFRLKDKIFSTENFNLKSDILKLYGSGRIGFDKTVSASLKTELDKEIINPGTKKDFASAVEKYTFVDVSGNLANPKYVVKPNVTDIIKDAARKFFQ